MNLSIQEQEVIQRFHAFLASKNLLDVFIHEVKEQMKTKPGLLSFEVAAREIINYLLEWSNTANGHCFWEHINNEWKSVCNREGCNITITNRKAILETGCIYYDKVDL